MMNFKLRIHKKPTGQRHYEPDKFVNIEVKTMSQYNKHVSDLRNHYPQQFYEITQE